MTWVIAILLGLILVAMVSSNQAAAAGVWTVVRFALWGILALVGWGILIGCAVWFYDAYPSDEWTQIIGLSCVVIAPPILLWVTRKKIAEAYKKDRIAALKFGALLVVYVFATMVMGVFIREVQDAYEYGGWALILVPLTGTCAILVWRSLTGSKGWREVWFGPPPLPEPWSVVASEQDAFDLAENDVTEKIYGTWDELTEEQQNVWRQEHQARVMANKKRLDEMRNRLEAEKKARIKDESWSVLGFFLLFLVFAVFGLIGIFWDLGFAYAMELKFVKGQAWAAGAVVIFTALAIAGLLMSIWESIAEIKAKKSKS